MLDKKEKFTMRDPKLYRLASMKRNIRIHVPEFAFKHDGNNKGKDTFVGRDIQFRRLFMWLTSQSKSGSYLVTGYRGMGKSLLVKKVMRIITREPKAYKETWFQFSIFSCLLFFFLFFHLHYTAWPVFLLFFISFAIAFSLHVNKMYHKLNFFWKIFRIPNHHLFDNELINKTYFSKNDLRHRKYNRINISVNLGQESLSEHDVLSILAQSIRDKYSQFVHNHQNRPLSSFFFTVILMFAGSLFAEYLVKPFICYLITDIQNLLSSLKQCECSSPDLWSISISIANDIVNAFCQHPLCRCFAWFLLFTLSVWLTNKIIFGIVKHVHKYSVPFRSIKRLNILIDRINAAVSEESGTTSLTSNSLFSISFLNNNRKKVHPMANVREIESELMSIVNVINSVDCPSLYRVQFILVFDELDKITKSSGKTLVNLDKTIKTETHEDSPEFETSVKGFTDAMAYEERKQNVLRLLANMKLFITSTRAKFVFISGHELYDASLADLSDREFAINSIFDGVLNVSSFLSPERGESDVNSLTERYIATMLLPSDYLANKMNINASEHDMLKEELPSLRWYNEYLMETHITKKHNDYMDNAEIKHKEDEIRFVVEFLRYFAVFLAHVCNGSPKKITIYFEKYIKLFYDVEQNVEWCDDITVGAPDNPKDLREQCVLYFNATDQKLINFVHYIAAPVMNAITNEVSNYGDKLLVSSSFILDQIYKYHGRGFSWRNFEQMPELLNPNKDAELRDSMLSIIEFLLQVHITTVSSGLYNYKFHKQISEEISHLSKISEEASAIFNFTLNESETVKRYNIRLLNHYVNLAKNTHSQRYSEVIERIHENLGDLYFSDEDYYRAVHEYKSALKYIMSEGKNITPSNVLQYLKCNLKVGLAYEYRRTYTNAYMVYCNIINQLVHLRWIDVDKLGLDITSRRTKDWRNKQSVLVYKQFCQSPKDTFQRQFNPGIYDDYKNNYWNIIYSLDSDRSITGLSQRMTPIKNDAMLQLTTFEEVAFVYQAILSKLFVIEKMEVSGITQSSLEQAEAEFSTLHRFVSLKDKFFISADFFKKMGQILYYKNTTVSSFKSGTLADALFRYAFINVLSFVDDFCFINCPGIGDTIFVKEKLKKYFDNKDSAVLEQKNNNFEFINLIPNKKKIAAEEEIAAKYLEYLNNNMISMYGKDKINSIASTVLPCANRHKELKPFRKTLPCHACQYTTRALDILLKYMFKQNNTKYEYSKAYVLLYDLNPEDLLCNRTNQIALLASTSESIANIMLSCSYIHVSDNNQENYDELNTVTFRNLTEYVNALIENKKPQKPTNLSDKTKSNNNSNLDRALLYYCAAYKFYDLVNKYKESAFCLGRMIKVCENYLRTLLFYSECNWKSEVTTPKCYELNLLLDKLFMLAARSQSWQFNGLNKTEIHAYKWLIHLSTADYIDLSQLTAFPELQPIFISVVKCKLLLYRLNISSCKQSYVNYLVQIYNRISPAFQHNKTFRGDIESYYMKAYVNKLFLCHLLNDDQPILTFNYPNIKQNSQTNDKFDYKIPFCRQLIHFLSSDNGNDVILKSLFACNDTISSKLDLIEFLVHDSLVALSYVLKILTPHNHITTFSNSFVAEVYDLLWEHSKYFEMLEKINRFFKNKYENNEPGCQSILHSMRAITDPDMQQLENLMIELSNLMMRNEILHKDNFGYRHNKLYSNFRHEIDDFSIEHTNTNYSAEMAIKYYKAALNINTEGTEYKNMIASMYILDDDLENDTCQANLADERFLGNCLIWDTKLKWYKKLYSTSAIYNLKHYESEPDNNEPSYSSLDERFEDSLYTNTEY